MNFSCNIIGELAHFSWTRDALAEGLAHYEIRLAAIPDNASSVDWSGGAYLATVAAGSETVSLPAVAGVYMIKAVNVQGKQSPLPASILSNASSAIDYTPVISRDLISLESLATAQFDSTVCGTSPAPWVALRNSDVLSLWPQMDVIDRMSVGYSPNLSRLGYYYPTTVIDLGGVFNVRLSVDLMATSEHINNVIEDWGALSSLLSLSSVDGAVTQARAEVMVSADAEHWGGWQEVGAISDISARYFKFRIRLSTDSALVSPLLSVAACRFLMPARIESKNDVFVPSDGLSVEFSRPYKDTPSLGVTLERLIGNWSYALTEKTASGFRIEIFQDGVPSAGQIDWIANGYGLGK